jgi:hypothetical protein
MHALIAFLLKAGGGILVRRAAREMAAMLAVYGLVAGLAVAALVFFYMAVYSWLAAALNAESAAAILCGANLVVIALILLVRQLSARRRRRGAVRPDGRPLLDGDLEAALTLGLEAGERLRKAAPEIALAAGLIGIIVGARPEILDIFRPRRKGPGGL